MGQGGPRRILSTIAGGVLVAASVAAALLAVATAEASSILPIRPMFPGDHVWNVRVDSLPVDANSAAYVATIGSASPAHADFGTVYAGAPNGIPYVVVGASQPRVAVTFDYADESDPGPYPIPADAPIEGGPTSSGDRHVLVVDRDGCKLYELFAAYRNADGTWHAGSGAVFDICGYALRPQTWTSADAAGLPILPGLVRYEEVAAGEIAHALRFTAPQTRNQFLWPARHQASSRTAPNYPPMGQRFRLKASLDISDYAPNVQVILRALKKYGMFLADNGSSWFLSGAPDPRWSDDELHQLGQLHGSDFEAVDESSLMRNVDSGQVSAGVATSSVATVDVVEFYRATKDHYFMTADVAEIGSLDAQADHAWTRTGQSFKAFAPGQAGISGTSSVCRLYGLPSAGLDTHFYSASPSECTGVAARFPGAWLIESMDVFAVALPETMTGECPAGMVPVYRSYDNRVDTNHRFTTSMSIQSQMLGAGWLGEGAGPLAIAMCAPPG
jgi:hypothetical protein